MAPQRRINSLNALILCLNKAEYLIAIKLSDQKNTFSKVGMIMIVTLLHVQRQISLQFSKNTRTLNKENNKEFQDFDSYFRQIPFNLEQFSHT